jgi:hypothetical protein
MGISPASAQSMGRSAHIHCKSLVRQQSRHRLVAGSQKSSHHKDLDGTSKKKTGLGMKKVGTLSPVVTPVHQVKGRVA